jgi:hypothetical protein
MESEILIIIEGKPYWLYPERDNTPMEEVYSDIDEVWLR